MERGQPILFRIDQGVEQWSLTFGAIDPTQGFLDLLSRETYLYAHTHARTHTHDFRYFPGSSVHLWTQD